MEKVVEEDVLALVLVLVLVMEEGVVSY